MPRMRGDDMGSSPKRHFELIYPLVISQFAIENDNLKWIFPLNMVIFQFAMYSRLPEGKP